MLHKVGLFSHFFPLEAALLSRARRGAAEAERSVVEAKPKVDGAMVALLFRDHRARRMRAGLRHHLPKR